MSRSDFEKGSKNSNYFIEILNLSQRNFNKEKPDIQEGHLSSQRNENKKSTSCVFNCSIQ